MLTVQYSGKYVRMNICSHAEKHPSFRLCGILDSLEKAVYSSVHNTSQVLSNVDIISKYDVDRLKQWVVKPAFARPNTIHRLINGHYLARPHATAISTTSRDVSYEDLGKKSALVAESLRKQGVRPGSNVGFRMDKSAAAIIIIVGILRAGAAYVPIDHNWPRDRTTNVIQKAHISHLVGDDGQMERIKGVQVLAANTLLEGEAPAGWSSEISDNPNASAYIMFTSGSTGTPKGAVHAQAGVAGGLLEVADSFGLGAATRFLQYASFTFDASICEIFAPLVVGGTVCVPSPEERVEDIGSVIHQLRVTDASLTPVVVRQLDSGKVPSLKSLYIGGEAPSSEIVDVWSDRVRLCNVYGTTETGVWDTIKLGMRKGDNPKNVGRGIGATCWIVDPSNVLKPQPIGVEGEVVIQGPYIGQGYLDSNEKTASSFMSPPSWIQNLSGNSKDRIYCTGDLAKYDHDGTILFRGRKSGFVKIRGLRIELGEIESSLNTLPPTAKSAVIAAQPDGNGNDAEIAAFMEVQADVGTSLADYVRGELSNKLPCYMIPTIAIPIDKMPLTESKKINRQDLHRRLRDMTASELISFRPGGSAARESKKIDPMRSLSIQLSHTIIDMVDTHGEGSLEYLRERDFPLSSVGLTSVHLAYLAGHIRRHWGFPVSVRDLQRPGMSVGDIEKFVMNGEAGSVGSSPQSTNILTKLQAMQPVIELFPPARKLTVLCTSITGFLGSQILRSLLQCPDVGRIIGIVRAETEAKALERVKEQAIIGRWWRDAFASRIDIWRGDLSKPNLGLTPRLWRTLKGSEDITIDAIIHNGARVNWMDDFDTLKPTNVDSTVEILRAISAMPTPCSLTYIGGGYLPSPDETKEDIAEKLSLASGYDQTKFLARMVLEEYNAYLDRINNATMRRAQIIQPGFIVGTKKEGIAHTEDFLWRLAYTVLHTGTVSEELRGGYIPVAGVDQIASLAIESILGREKSVQEVIDCRDGIHLSHFCDILSAKTGNKIQTVPNEKWLEIVESDIENAPFDHPFLPVLDWFEENHWQFSSEACKPPEELLFDKKDVYAATEKSVEYAVDIGYLPSATHCSQARIPNGVPRFRRSSR